MTQIVVLPVVELLNTNMVVMGSTSTVWPVGKIKKFSKCIKFVPTLWASTGRLDDVVLNLFGRLLVESWIKISRVRGINELNVSPGNHLERLKGDRNRPLTHPGEMLFEEFVKPLDLTQAKLARRLDVPYPRLNEIIKGSRLVTPDTALRLSRVLGMSADFWLGLQQDWDLWHAMNSPDAKQINRLKPISTDQHFFA